jgi:hypothetical protein
MNVSKYRPLILTLNVILNPDPKSNTNSFFFEAQSCSEVHGTKAVLVLCTQVRNPGVGPKVVAQVFTQIPEGRVDKAFRKNSQGGGGGVPLFWVLLHFY